MFVNITNMQAIWLSMIASIMALLVAMPFHEFAHAYAAKREGDWTAVAQKRYTLAFHSHFDVIGFVSLFLFGFGWAKPVPVDSRNFKRGKKSEISVSIAGIVMNLILGTAFLFIYLLLIKFLPVTFQESAYGYLVLDFLSTSVSLNFMLAFFNLLPIYPLDGYRLVESLSNGDNAFLSFMRKYSTIIYIVIVITGICSILYYATMGYLVELLTKLFSLILGL